MDLVKLPNKRLRLPCEDAAPPLEGEDFTKMWGLIHTMRERGGIGLAGPQIGWQKRVFVVDVEAVGASPHENGTGIEDIPDALGGDWLCCLNAVFTPTEEIKHEMWEGCLSIPRVQRLMRRPERGVVEYTDQEGKPWKYEVSGLLARVFQHETDHTNGVLITSKEHH